MCVPELQTAVESALAEWSVLGGVEEQWSATSDALTDSAAVVLGHRRRAPCVWYPESMDSLEPLITTYKWKACAD